MIKSYFDYKPFTERLVEHFKESKQRSMNGCVIVGLDSIVKGITKKDTPQAGPLVLALPDPCKAQDEVDSYFLGPERNRPLHGACGVLFAVQPASTESYIAVHVLHDMFCPLIKVYKSFPDTDEGYAEALSFLREAVYCQITKQRVFDYLFSQYEHRGGLIRLPVRDKYNPLHSPYPIIQDYGVQRAPELVRCATAEYSLSHRKGGFFIHPHGWDTLTPLKEFFIPFASEANASLIYSSCTINRIDGPTRDVKYPHLWVM